MSVRKKVHDMSPPGTPSAAKSVEQSPTPVPESKSESGDYVWDVFYHRPTKLCEWNAVANIGTLCVPFLFFISPGLFVIFFSCLRGWHRTGLPPSTTDPYDL